MRVQVGPWEYRVRLVRGYVQYRGEPCFGLCDHLKREILIADVLDRGQRLHVFVHELVHAWWHYCPGEINDEEAVADLMAMAVSRLLIQVVGDPQALKLFDRERGDGVAPLDLPTPMPPEICQRETSHSQTRADAQGEHAKGELPVKVERKVLPGDGAGQEGWVVRIFKNPLASDSKAEAADD